MDNARQVTQNGEQDVDEEISIASALKEYTDGRQNDGKDDLADIAVLTRLVLDSHDGANSGYLGVIT